MVVVTDGQGFVRTVIADNQGLIVLQTGGRRFLTDLHLLQRLLVQSRLCRYEVALCRDGIDNEYHQQQTGK
jgi:hypothetical protein